MGPQRKPIDDQHSYESARDDACFDAHVYEADLTPEALAELHERANRALGNEKWKLIDGYAGGEQSAVDEDAAVGV